MTRQPVCFHCGDRLPGGAPIVANLHGNAQAMCCIGCKAVAEFIAASGLGAFYDFRSHPDADLQLRPETNDWQHFDDSKLLNRYVGRAGNSAEATIDIGGMYCSACVWLLDKALGKVDGIESIDINPAVRRAVIRWDPQQLRFSRLLDAISQVGFRPAPVSASQIASEDQHESRLALKRLIVAGAAGMQVMMFAVALYAGDFFGIEPGIEKFLRWISLLLTLPVFLFSARPFFTAAWRGLKAWTPGMDLPVSIAIIAAFTASAYATWVNRGEVYFDSVVMFVFFLSATRFLEMRARHRSLDQATALARLLPDTAVRLVNGVGEKIAVDRLQAGDEITVRPGDVIPVDGEILLGVLDVDESMLSGESLPVARATGSDVFAGAIVRTGTATIRVTQVGASTSLAEIGRMIDRAKAFRPPIALLADRIAGKFVVAVIVLAAAATLFWLQLDPSRAFGVALATLVVTCPCALALATPAALAAATVRLTRSGMLLVRSSILDVLSGPAVIVFDKTGTLTEGRPVVRQTHLLSDTTSEESVLRVAAILESASEHVLARAFSAWYPTENIELSDVRVVAGCGVEAVIAGERTRIGSAGFVCELSAATPPVEDDTGQTNVYLGDTHGLVARFDVGDKLRDDAVNAIAAMRSAGFQTIIASGDRESPVRAAAQTLNIETWHSGLSPADKLDLLQQLRRAGDTVVMIGDGVNDAPVLAAADASIALDAGTALARASADAVSLGRKLGTINMTIEIAKRTQRVIRQNIGWAIIYNLTALPLALSGVLAPWMAAIGMSASSLLVVLNALRLQRAELSEVSS